MNIQSDLSMETPYIDRKKLINELSKLWEKYNKNLLKSIREHIENRISEILISLLNFKWSNLTKELIEELIEKTKSLEPISWKLYELLDTDVFTQNLNKFLEKCKPMEFSTETEIVSRKIVETITRPLVFIQEKPKFTHECSFIKYKWFLIDINDFFNKNIDEILLNISRESFDKKLFDEIVNTYELFKNITNSHNFNTLNKKSWNELSGIVNDILININKIIKKLKLEISKLLTTFNSNYLKITDKLKKDTEEYFSTLKKTIELWDRIYKLNIIFNVFDARINYGVDKKLDMLDRLLIKVNKKNNL